MKQEKIPKVKKKDLKREITSDRDNYMNDFTCIICYNEIGEESFVTDLPDCHHTYHHKCISEWFKINSKCPLCKKDYINRFDNNQPPVNLVDPQPIIRR